jgi:hypothetical protein
VILIIQDSSPAFPPVEKSRIPVFSSARDTLRKSVDRTHESRGIKTESAAPAETFPLLPKIRLFLITAANEVLKDSKGELSFNRIRLPSHKQRTLKSELFRSFVYPLPLINDLAKTKS